MKQLAEKIAFLHSNNYDLQESKIIPGAIIGMHNETMIGVTLHNDQLCVDNVATTGDTVKQIFKVDGWEELSIDAFKMLCASLGLIAVQKQELSTCVQIAEYRLQLNPNA